MYGESTSLLIYCIVGVRYEFVSLGEDANFKYSGCINLVILYVEDGNDCIMDTMN